MTYNNCRSFVDFSSDNIINRIANQGPSRVEIDIPCESLYGALTNAVCILVESAEYCLHPLPVQRTSLFWIVAIFGINLGVRNSSSDSDFLSHGMLKCQKVLVNVGSPSLYIDGQRQICLASKFVELIPIKRETIFDITRDGYACNSRTPFE